MRCHAGSCYSTCLNSLLLVTEGTKKYNRIARPLSPVIFLLSGTNMHSFFPFPQILPLLHLDLQQIGVRAFRLRINKKMAPETRSQDMRKMEESLEAANQRIDGVETSLHAQSDDLAQLKAMIKEMANQQIAIKQTLQALAGEASSSQGILTPQHVPTPNHPDWAREGSLPTYRSRRPRRDFPTFEGEEVHKWLYKCNQYFDLEEIPENDKLKLASYYLDGMALYWHQNYTRNLEGQELTWPEYVDALYYRFGGQRDPLEELTKHKQEGDLEGYIKDFDMLWNRAQISEKQALVFFLGGLEIKIKNLVKMFEPKSLKQAYNLARLHNNTFTHRKVTPHFPKSQGQVAHNPYSTRYNYSANLNQTNPNPLKTSSPALLPTPTNFPPNNPRPIKPIRKKEMDDRRAKGCVSGASRGLCLVIGAEIISCILYA